MAATGGTPQDNYGYFGPEYNFADNIPLPGEIGVRQEPSIGAIIDSVGGVNFYVDTIAFGGPTFFDQHNPQPMGTRYFLNTGVRCSNGATMSTYMDGVTRGDLLGVAVADALASAGLPGLKGLAPGMLENARDALDPRPIFAAVTGTGYPVCQQVQCPVGDVNGSITNARDSGGQPYILDPVQYVNGMPTQTRWVQAYDQTGSQIQVTKDEFGAQPKCYNADGTVLTPPPDGCPASEPPAINQQGVTPYQLCTVAQPATLPPGYTSGSASSSEGFAVAADADERLLGMVLTAAVGVGVVWWLARRR